MVGVVRVVWLGAGSVCMTSGSRMNGIVVWTLVTKVERRCEMNVLFWC